MNEAQERREDQALLGVNTDDKLALVFVSLACITGMMFALSSVGYLLGFNATTLWVASFCFPLLGSGITFYPEQKTTEEQLAYVPLALIPIALRVFLNGVLFSSFQADLQSADITGLAQIGYLVEVIGLWILVAVSEEGFRATVMMLLSLIIPDKWEYSNLVTSNLVKWVLSVILWVFFHFYQRGFENLQLQAPYILWLIITGLVFTYIMDQGSFGGAVLAHIIVNLTA